MEDERSRFIKEHRCIACGGNLVFRPEKGKLVCEYCDSEYEVPADDPSVAGTQNAAQGAAQNVAQNQVQNQQAAPANPNAISGFDFTQFYQTAMAPAGETLPIYHCKSCGAEVIVAQEEASLTCPYCASKIVLSDKMSGNIRPNAIIPFKLAQKDLKKHIDEFYKDKKLLPRNFFDKSRIEKVTGVYVPFWFFSGRLYGRYSYDAQTSSTTTEKDYKVTTTRFYHVERDAQMAFAGIPIDASDKIDDSLMDSVFPYDMSELRPFQTGYLSGFTADRFDVPGKQLQNRAERLMKKTSSKVVDESLSGRYGYVKQQSAAQAVDNVQVQYILLPVYMFKLKFGKKKYQFAINGQTGKVVGTLPTSKATERLHFWPRLGIVAGAIMLVSIISYFMGGAF